MPNLSGHFMPNTSLPGSYAGLQLWLDSNYGLSLVNDGTDTVSAIRDRSNAHNDMTTNSNGTAPNFALLTRNVAPALVPSLSLVSGNSDRIITPSITFTSQLTILFTMRPNVSNTLNLITGTGSTPFFTVDGIGRLKFADNGGGTLTGSGTITSGVTQCYAVVVSGTACTLYLNGVQDNTTASGFGTSSTIVRIGIDTGGLSANVCEVCIWTSALSADAITALYRYSRDRWF